MNQSLTTQWKRDCWRGKKYRKTRKKNSPCKGENQKQSQPQMASTPGLEAWATFVGGECSNHCSHHGDALAPWIDVCTHEQIIKSKRCWVHLFSFSLYDGVDPSTWFSFLLRNCLCSMACFTMLGRLMPCFLRKLSLCLYEKAGWPASWDLPSSNHDLSKRGSQPSHTTQQQFYKETRHEPSQPVSSHFPFSL